MDPDANLAELRRLAIIVGDTTHERDTARLVDLIQALDQWITGGGFLPAAWRSPLRLPATRP